MDLLRRSPLPLAVSWGDAGLTVGNPAFDELLGWSTPGTTARRASEIWRDDGHAVGPLLEERLRGGEFVTHGPVRLLRPRGQDLEEETYAHFDYTPLLQDDGTVGGFLCAGRDDSERVRAARRLALLRELAAALTGVADEPALIGACARALATQPSEIPFAWLLAGAPAPAGRPVLLYLAPEYEAVLPGPDAESAGAPWASDAPSSGVVDWPAPPGAKAWVLPVWSSGQPRAVARVVLGVPPRRPVDEAAHAFLDLVARQVAQAWQAVEAARERATRRESEEPFRNLADHAPVMLRVTDAAGRCTYLNRRWYEFSGQPPGAAEDRGWWDIVHPADRPGLEARFAEALARPEPFTVEYRAQRADGDYRWLLDSAAPRFSAGRQFLGFVGSLMDITERRQQELSAQAQAEHLRLALTASQSGDWSWDSRTDLVTFSPRAAEIFGIPPGPVMTWTALRGLLVPEDAERAARAVAAALTTNTDYDIEYRVVRPEGGVSWVAVRGRGVYAENGDVLGMLGVVQEINGRKRAEQVLLDREQRMNRLLSLVPAGIYACDAEGRITFYNKRAAELWGMEPPLLAEYRSFCSSLRAFDLSGRFVAIDQRAMIVAVKEQRSFRDAHAILERPDGSRWVMSANIDPLQDAEGRPSGAINVFLDVTERRRGERLAAGQNRALRLLATGRPLPEVLTELLKTAEEHFDGVSAASVVLLDATDGRFRVGAAPTLPAEYRASVDGANEGPPSGVAAAAIRRGEVVLARELATDGAAGSLDALPMQLGYRSGWAVPIIDAAQRALGAFVLYGWEPREPGPDERQVADLLARTAAIAIGRRVAEEALAAAEAQLRLVTDHAPVMLTQCDEEQRFIFANRAYLERRALSAAEVIGRPLQEVVGDELHGRIRPYVELVMAGVRVDYEIDVEFPRVGRRWLSVSHVPDRAPNGSIRGWVTAMSDITENRLADAATRQLAAIVESSEDAIISKDLDGRLTSWNRGAERLFGYAAADVLRLPVEILVPADRLERERHLLGGGGDVEVAQLETVRRRKDGSLIDVSLTISMIKDAQERTVGSSIIARDITGRKRHEAELQRREQLYRAIGESIDFGVWVCDAAGRLVYASESFLQMIGMTQAEAAGEGWRAALHPDERAASADAWQAGVQAGSFWEREHTFRGADGGWFPVLTRGVPIRDEQGQITSWVGINLDIGALKAAQEAARQGEARFREIADNIPLFAWMADPGGKIFWYNQRWIDYTGLGNDEAADESGELVHPEHRARVVEKYRQAFAAGQIWEDTFPLRGKAGTYRWFLSRAVPIQDAQGRTLRWFGTNTDVTDLRQAQEHLRQRGQTLETLNRVGNTLVAQLDLGRILQTVTDAGREISGATFGAFFYNRPSDRGEHYALAAVSGLPREQVERSLSDETYRWIGKVFRAAAVVRTEDMPSGSPVHALGALAPDATEVGGFRSTLAVPVISRIGETVGGLFFGHSAPAAFTDITENILTGLAAQSAIALDNANLYAALQRELMLQKRADAALRASERQLRLVTDNASVYLILLDRDHRFKFANRPYAQRYGREPQDILGLRIADLIGPAGYEAVRPPLEAAFRGERVDFEVEVPYEQLGPRWMHIVHVPERSPEGAVIGVLGVLSDITARRQAEREVEEARDRAVAASRAKDDFLAALSHELRTPLNPVLLLASEAAEDASLSKDVRDTFSTIRNNVELEARLIDDLLDLTRISHGKMPLEMREHDAHAILQEAVATVQVDIGQKQIEVELEFGAFPSEVWADAVRLQQVFWNILKNAVKFTPRGGRVGVRTWNEPDAERLIVEVSDTGIGMAPAELSRIFEAFVQGDHAGHGSHRFGGVGLGLAISRMLVEQHQGCIRAESEGPNRGSTFVVELPLAQTIAVSWPRREASPARQASSRLRTPPAAATGGQVLLVEDHEPTRLTLATLLRRRGFDVTCATSVAEARARAAERHFALLISDIGLPDGDGYELMRELRARQALNGIALSGYGMEDDIARSEAAGFQHHLTKPVRIQSLDRALAEVAKQRCEAAPG